MPPGYQLVQGRPNNAEDREAQVSMQRVTTRYSNSHADASIPLDGHGQQSAADESRGL